ncbi:MAG: hypothetical protein LPK45_01685 [Bacteroidota bacterium]|nr:hypothetical protein [Bacteroidota bacterium]MDX5429746.1 hypothetical protein [Bacteroidota bacterium]MDX5468525.1 hypothetical protein [Bacteroidota bacterium]
MYSKSDIHVHGPEYEFTVYKAKAHDRPTPVTDKAYYTPTLMTIPQFNFRLGYQVNDKWSVSLGWDHMKYVMDQNQVAEISGFINHPDYTVHNGTYLRTPTRLTEDLFKFEHTDGLNITSLDLERRFPLVQNRNKTLSLYALLGAGSGIVVPRSDVRVCTVGLNNDWHISGYHLNGKAGLRLEFLRNGFFQMESRSGYVNLPNVLIQNDEAHRIDHHFFFLEWYGSLGLFFKVF